MKKKYLDTDTPTGGVVNIGDELPLWSAPFGLKLLDKVRYKPDISALDIGFGSGFPLIELAMRLGEGSVVYGIDPWEAACERAGEKALAYGVYNVRILQGVAESIPLEDESIDLIVSNNGINNVGSREQVLDECGRVSRSGAQLVLTMNLDQSMYEVYQCFEKVLMARQMDDAVNRMHRHIAEKRPPVAHLLRELRDRGFVIREQEYDQFNYCFTDGTAMLNHYQIRSGFLNAWVDMLPQGKVEEVFDALEDELNIQARRDGALRLSIPFVVICAEKS